MPHGSVAEAAKNRQRLLCSYAAGRLQVPGSCAAVLCPSWSSPRQHVAKGSTALSLAAHDTPTQGECQRCT